MSCCCIGWGFIMRTDCWVILLCGKVFAAASVNNSFFCVNIPLHPLYPSSSSAPPLILHSFIWTMCFLCGLLITGFELTSKLCSQGDLHNNMHLPCLHFGLSFYNAKVKAWSSGYDINKRTVNDIELCTSCLPASSVVPIPLFSIGCGTNTFSQSNHRYPAPVRYQTLCELK